MKAWLQKLLFDWVFVLLYKLFKAFLNLVDLIESFFDVFAGTAKILYQGKPEFLINVFFGHNAVTNAFWAMALIAIVMAFGFCIVQLARKSADISGAVKQSVGQILSNFFRCLLIIVLINAITVASINITNVLLDRINFTMENASVLHQEEEDKTFTEEEYAAMTRILATVANYSVNPSAESRYNVNSCFNAIRADLLSLYSGGFFNYDYPLDDNGHYTWQGALALLASSADLTQDLNLDTYYADVVAAFRTVSRELSIYSDFAPIQSAHFSQPNSIDTDVLIFLIAGMQASQNSMYNTGDFNDAIRKGYISGEKNYNDLTQVRKDFDIWEMDYLAGYVACIVFIIIMAICIFTFIVRMFNLLLLYITAPLFASSMPMDDGGKWQSWTQAFVIQLFSGFGIIIAMRLYLIIIPVIISSDLVFFSGSGTSYAILNRMAQMLMILGGAWAVLQSGSVITGILAGNPGMAAIQQEGMIGGKVMGWATRAPRAAVGNTVGLASGAAKGAKYLKNTSQRRADKAESKAKLATRKAQRQQSQADALFAKADRMEANGGSRDQVARMRAAAEKTQQAADKSAGRADRLNTLAGTKPSDSVIERAPRGGAAAAPADNASGGADGGAAKQRTPPPLPTTPPPSRQRAQRSAGGNAAQPQRPATPPPTRARSTGSTGNTGSTGGQHPPLPTTPPPSRSGRSGGASAAPKPQRPTTPPPGGPGTKH